jgi:hypothetical protein
MIVGPTVRSRTNIGMRTLAGLAEVDEKRRRIVRRELDTQADQSPFPGKTRQKIDDAVKVRRIDVEPDVERNGRKGRAVYTVAKRVHRRPGFGTEVVNGKAFPRSRHEELERVRGRRLAAVVRADENRNVSCQIDLHILETPKITNPQSLDVHRFMLPRCTHGNGMPLASPREVASLSFQPQD